MNLNYFLRVNRQFADFSAGEIATFERALAVERYHDGHCFIHEGEPGDAMYLIVEGQVLVTRGSTPAGEARIICMLGAGDMFGLIALIDQGPRCASCTAVGEVLAARLSASAFRELFEADASLAHRFQYLIARQLAADLRLYNSALLDAIEERETPPVAAEALEAASYEHRPVFAEAR